VLRNKCAVRKATIVEIAAFFADATVQTFVTSAWVSGFQEFTCSCRHGSWNHAFTPKRRIPERSTLVATTPAEIAVVRPLLVRFPYDRLAALCSFPPACAICSIAVGNLLTANDQALCLALAFEWTDEDTVIAVHNPTEAEIEATIQSPPSIDDRMRIDLRVAIPPGASVLKTIGRKPQ
jgi:hypothetical protein